MQGCQEVNCYVLLRLLTVFLRLFSVDGIATFHAISVVKVENQPVFQKPIDSTMNPPLSNIVLGFDSCTSTNLPLFLVCPE